MNDPLSARTAASVQRAARSGALLLGGKAAADAVEIPHDEALELAYGLWRFAGAYKLGG